MKQKNTPELNELVSNSLPVTNAFLKNVALGGPGLVAVIRYPDLKLVFVNDQFEHYLGYSNADIDHACFTDLLEEHQYDRFVTQLATVKDNIAARSGYCMYPLKNKSGVAMSYYLYAAPLPDRSPVEEELYYLLLQPDLSKWGMPFTSFDTKELFLEQFDADDFGTFEWLIDAEKVFWSVGVYRIYEVNGTEGEIGHSFIREFTHPQYKAWVKELTKNAIESGSDLNFEYKIITAKKNVKLIHCLARIITDASGKPIKLAGSIRDITGQRSIENDLKKKVEELNHSNKELEEFAYVASHDLQEPLRKITTFSDRLAEKYKDALTGDGAMYLARMIVSAENMRTLINDLLEFSRITKSVIPFGPVDLDGIVKQVITDLELIIEETGTTINCQHLGVIDAIALQMQQLFANIINNAIKFRKPGVAPVITVEAVIITDEDKVNCGLDPANKYHKMQITDNGIGFEAEYATRIFQVFQRLHGKSEYPGSGIGLAICKKILEYHHGVIYAESLADGGARFTFILPERQKNRT